MPYSFCSRQFQLHSTLKPITPYGGLVSLLSFFNKIALPAPIGAAMLFCYRSPNAIEPAQTLVTSLITVVAGSRRLATPIGYALTKPFIHSWVWSVFQALTPLEVRNFFQRFNQTKTEAYWRPMWRWLLGLGWPVPTQGFSLYLNSTLLQSSGSQQEAARGYNPISRPREMATRTPRLNGMELLRTFCSLLGFIRRVKVEGDRSFTAVSSG